MGMGPLGIESRHTRAKQFRPTKDEAFEIFMDYTHWRVDAQLVPREDLEPWLGPAEGFAAQSRIKECCIGAEDRIGSFCEIVEAFDEAAAVAESGRCLQCDLRLKITPVRFWGDY